MNGLAELGMMDLTIGGTTFTVLIEGDETLPVLVLSNALGSDVHLWDAQMPALLDHFRVVRYNSRGHGGSTIGSDPYSIEGLGQDALAILDALGIEKTHWLGLSKGGAVGLWLLINAPNRIERAVLANTSARFAPPDTWNERILRVQQDGLGALVDVILKRWFTDDFAGRQAGRVAALRQTLLTTSPEGYAASCAALRDMDLRAGLHAIEHAVLIIAGRDDLAVDPAETAFLAQTIPDAKLVTLETRHISNVEDPIGFTKAVLDFLLAKAPARRSVTRQVIRPLLPARRPAGRRAAAARLGAPETPRRPPSVSGPGGRTPSVTPERSPARPASSTKTASSRAAVPKTGSLDGVSTKPASAKTKTKVMPAKTKAAPSKTKPAPVKAKAAPVKAMAAPAKTKAAPAKTKAAPVKTKAAPVKTKAAPVKTKAAPAKTKPAPVKTKPAPVKIKPAPVKIKPAPVKAKAAPVKTKPAPVKAKAAPVKAKATPVKAKATPVKAKAAPVKAKATPVKAKATPVKAKATPVKAKATPVKAKATPVKAKATPVKAKATPVKAKATPVKAKATPVKAKAMPVKAKATPVKAKATPVKAKATPVKAKATPVKAKATPVKAKATPVKTKAAPVKVRAAPVRAKAQASKTARGSQAAAATPRGQSKGSSRPAGRRRG